MAIAYLAFEGFEKELEREIQFYTGQQVSSLGRLFLFNEDHDFVWAQLKLVNVEILEIESISKAAKALKERNRLWACYAFHLHRRTQLIQDQVGSFKFKSFDFLQPIPTAECGFWCLLRENKMLVSTRTASPFPLGEVKFHEDKVKPPSRAYLKLWEAFTVHVTPPAKGEIVMDLGSCPGGWTWVLQTLGAEVLSVDKAPLDEKIRNLPHIQFIKKDAFKLRPSEVQRPSWLLSDIICEPARLLELVQVWINAYPDLRCLCTIKYKGDTDFMTTELFRKIPGSRIIHLCANKHEVTWIRSKYI